MGVYIDMEMPKPGQIVLVEIDENGDVFAAYDGGRTKLTHHKAVSVPDPHGDLIERDALTISTAVPLDGKPYQYVHINNIKAAPTIIPADEPDMDSFIRIFEEDDEEDGMDSFIRILKD